MRIRSAVRCALAFTLVELLVAMALIVLIMAILSEAFVEGLASVRHLKAIGDMQENLRTAIVPLRDDLLQRHFDGTQKLSVSFNNYTRPQTGFLRIQQGSPAILEGTDSDGIPSSVAAAHILHLTVKSVGARRTDYLVGEAPAVPLNFFNQQPCRHLWFGQGVPADYRQANAYLSQWAEVMWFLTPMIDRETGLQMTAGGGDTLLWTLHRRQRLLIEEATARPLNTIGSPDRIPSQYLGRFADLACKPDPRPFQSGFLYFCTPSGSENIEFRSMVDVTNSNSLPHAVGSAYPAHHPGAQVPNVEPETVNFSGGWRLADDRVTADVISFEIKVLLPGSFEFQDVPDLAGTYDTSTWPVNNPAVNGGGDDSKLTIRAIQIILRVWDSRTEQTRQMTMIQDM